MSNRQLLAATIGLQQIFERHRDRPWVFLRPLGNWGDNLIYAGAEMIADALGLQRISCGTPEFQAMTTTPEHCIYLQGGGGYNSWSSGRAFVNLELALARQVHLVVQGPVSVAGQREWLAKRFQTALSCVNCRESIFFAREAFTNALLHELALQDRGLTVCLDHDTALALTAKDLLAIAGLAAMPSGSYDMIVLREDNEKPEPSTTTRSTTAAAAAPTRIVLDPAYEAANFRHWVRIHLHARSITTNRLHSSIIGAIAGKRVALGPGSYYKNRGVWEYSLAGRGVEWVDRIEPPAASLWERLPTMIRNNPKVRQLRLALHGVPLR